MHNGLAVPVREELLLEMGRCSLALGDLDRAVKELSAAFEALPRRADVGIELAEAFLQREDPEAAVEVLLRALPYMDPLDRLTVKENPELRELLAQTPLPARSVLRSRITLERGVLAVLVLVALAHGLRVHLNVF